MVTNLILSNKNIGQFGDISSCEIFLPDDIIHPGISMSALICLQFLNHIIITKTKVFSCSSGMGDHSRFRLSCLDTFCFYASTCF